jgi:uncharacterized MAPEG superfamily protein
MPIELTYLIWSAGLGLVYLSVQAGLYRRQIGIAEANTTRDNEPAPDLMAGRGNRALRNFLETYGIFAALAAGVTLANTSDWMTQWGCHLYFWARVVYLPLYIFGISPARSYVWTLSLVGLILLFIGAVL